MGHTKWMKPGSKGASTVMNVLDVRDLRVSFSDGKQDVAIVRGISFSVQAGGFHGLVGESGCGKSVTAMSLTRLPPADAAICSGEVLFKGQNVLPLRGATLRAVRGRGGVSYIFQDPMSALNPVLTVGTQMREALPPGFSSARARQRMLALFSLVDLPGGEQMLRAYPCELSGGMAQRICIAMAMASEPALLVADEPTTALDVLAQKRVMDLLRDLCVKTGVAVLLITHNLGLVAGYAEDVSVMYAGRIVEHGDVKAVLLHPAHPYTRGLIAAVPTLDGGGVEALATIPGRVPPASDWGFACAFAPRCAWVLPVCVEQMPELKEVGTGQCAACFAVEATTSQQQG